MNENKCILFAGVTGSSKTPIATYLSYHLGLPIFNNDAIRSEVAEDLGIFNQQEYEKRRDERGKRLIASHRSFIYDASIDREWLRLKEGLDNEHYGYFIISLDLGMEMVKKMYQVKEYNESLTMIDRLINDHKTFLEQNNELVNLHITDDIFNNRLELSLAAVRTWLAAS